MTCNQEIPSDTHLVTCANCGIVWTDNPNGICSYCLERLRLPDGLNRWNEEEEKR